MAECNHIIGHTRTIRTAVLVVEYLRTRKADPHSLVHKDSIRYRFKDPTKENGFWSADIFVVTFNDKYDSNLEAAINSMIEPCRAFVAGAGEIWG